MVRQLGATPSVRGKDMVLTIDQELQDIALKRIEGLRVASIVVLDVVTGGILVMASYPTFDPNEISFKVNRDRWRELARHKDHPLENRALRGVYPPGSTFKVVTALAGLEAGVITPDETMTCPGSYVFARHRFRCWKTHGGGIDVHNAIKQSCDTYFYETVKRVGIDRLAVTSRPLGLGQIHDIGFTGQKPGIIPDKAWKRRTLNQPWYDGETISCGIGQGYVGDDAPPACRRHGEDCHGKGGVAPLAGARRARRRAPAAARHRSGPSRDRARRHVRRGQ